MFGFQINFKAAEFFQMFNMSHLFFASKDKINPAN